jgi:[ribosomal protein S18]-alanine N-acetyltransferase
VKILPACRHDLAAIHEIERDAFRTTWSPETFEAELGCDHARIDVLHDGDPPRLVGYCNYWLIAASQEVHILSIATHPMARRQGVGARLLEHALAAGATIEARLATLEVRRSNLAAVTLYERFGFTTIHVRVRYYADGDEDALVMTASLPTVPPATRRP